jgi:hypothetical protein
MGIATNIAKDVESYQGNWNIYGMTMKLEDHFNF